MTIRGIHHTGIIVSDLDRSIEFYHGLLGFPFQSEPSPWFDGDELAQGVGVPGARLRQCCLLVGDGVLELLEYENREPSDGPVHQNHLGAMHVAFRVDDVAAVQAELEAKGVEFFSSSHVVDDGVLAGWRWVYFHDPDGIPLELVEVAYTRPEERRQGIAAYLDEHPTTTQEAVR
ncbi:VOC family protein [Amnibacterium kyonggiense]|uniref:Lactoylglutathione lyase n=1 Tax=Amnibacterium kyonggiense TaxID=595671 RepID=A0A4R7FE73_9MICO|nr:VOC family protein [Amnibacterium kyonggiense]TDS75643.1 lactoylglutathione lyase [Amnibacterium kyonggiense]